MLDSKLQVSSISVISLGDSLHITKSGLELVTKIWGGMVAPLISWSLRSAVTEILGDFESFITCVRYWRIPLCLQVNLPCLRATEHQLRMCSSVPLFPQSGHLPRVLTCHLLRLSGVARELVADRMANERIPLRICLI